MGGRDKLLEPVQGQPLLAERAATAKGLRGDVIVVVQPTDDARKLALASLNPRLVRCVDVDGPDIGLGVSIAAGAAAARDDWPLMILPGDMPDLSADDLSQVLRAFSAQPDRITRGSSADGKSGHPVIFPARYLPRLRRLSGDDGARSIVEGEDVALVTLPGQHALTDLDTPEDWATWRRSAQ